ncbi:zinc ribbon domain-containing protein [Macrococcoides canis]|uniref:zinc ribbon domain-containing protein n=1 Tax=Macrococcoides canis TaxID=1855823 RepID=UPI0013E9257A|nr:zinc ribbon domain-containing protein [Macrococcus canis]QIH75263.1 hypothetical protein GTN31_02775 [Macrococcus canis]QTQ08655.1 zinc ribbon domain-containing protein [Macrococcus canis]QUR94101.1 hypothetical protein GOY09_03635 [Macrococcus canis]UTH02949.1 zinc ribbon domain-containing protein [Macrococcus canis]UTH12071.1 zinc ribbon domain-containing protein [Macrococcus canis]
MRCNQCNNEVGINDAFCGECGNDLRAQRAQEKLTQTESQSATDSTVTYEPKKDSVIHNEQQEQPQVSQQQTTHQAQQTQQTHQAPPIINKEQVNEQSKALVNEGKGFFRQAFRAHDEEVTSNHHFTPALSAILVLAGLIIVGILLALAIPDEVGYFGTSKGDIITKLLFSSFLLLAILFLATFLLSKFLINNGLTFAKALSDFVLINVYSIIFIALGLLLYVVDSYKIASALTFIGVLLLIFSGIYLISKYSARIASKIPTYLIITIYAIITLIALIIFKDIAMDLIKAIITSIVQSQLGEFGELFDGLFNN